MTEPVGAKGARFVVLEGGEASGKSTQAARLGDRLGAVLTREPGGTTIGAGLRGLLLDARTTGLDDRAEALLMAADRAQHVAEVVRPALAAGRHVVSDRYVGSTLAYQGYGRGLDLALLRSLNEIASQGIIPDLTFLLDLPPAVGLTRTRERGLAAAKSKPGSQKPGDRFEQEALEFHERVRSGFLKLAQEEPQRIIVLDARLPPVEVHEQIKRIMGQRLRAN
ncbi:MAG: dTMP kinase [Acidimicrobiales bacterium]